jgi:hypothetical protein
MRRDYAVGAGIERLQYRLGRGGGNADQHRDPACFRREDGKVDRCAVERGMLASIASASSPDNASTSTTCG